MRNPRFKAYDTKWERWIQPRDINYCGEMGWTFERRAEEEGDVIEFTTLEQGEVELLEYIGIPDKTGKEICEGDVIRKYHKNCVGVNEHWNGKEGDCLEIVQWVGSGFSLCVGERNIPFWWIEKDYDFEIIGNKFDNPELLKKGTK